MTKEELDKQTSDELFKAFLAFVLLVVLLCMVKIGLAHFRLESEPVEPFRYQGVKV